MNTHRRRLSLFGATVALLVAACGGSASATVTPTDPPAPTDGAAPTSAPATQGGGAVDPGAGSVEVTLTGGQHAGTYTGSENPNCTYELIGTGAWGVQYSIVDAAADQLSSFQLVLPGEGQADSPEAFMPGVELMATATIGDLMNGTPYEIKVMSGASGAESSGEGSATVDDKGDTAVIRVTGTTADGVGIDAVVTCPSVMRAGG